MSQTSDDRTASGKAVASLVFAILGITCCPCIGSFVAVMLGLDERSGVGRAGFHLGWIGPLILIGFNLVGWTFLWCCGSLAACSS